MEIHKAGIVTKIEAKDVVNGKLMFPDEAIGVQANVQEMISKRLDVTYIDFNNVEWFNRFEHSINWADNHGTEIESRLSNVFPNIICINAPKLQSIHAHFLENARHLETINLSIVQSIEEKAFQNCSLLEEIVMPNVKKIQAQAFAYCSSLVKVKGLTYAGHDPSSIEYIGLRAFKGTGIKKIHLCGNVKVEQGAFEETNIESVYIENSVDVSTQAFLKCNKIAFIYAAGSKSARFWIDDAHLYTLQGEKPSDDKKMICTSRTMAVKCFRAACSYIQESRIDNDRDLYILEDFDRYVLVNHRDTVAVLLNSKEELDDALKVF